MRQTMTHKAQLRLQKQKRVGSAGPFPDPASEGPVGFCRTGSPGALPGHDSNKGRRGSKFNIKSSTSNAQPVKVLKSHALHMYKQALSQIKFKTCLDKCKSNRIGNGKGYSVNKECFHFPCVGKNTSNFTHAQIVTFAYQNLQIPIYFTFEI